MDDLIDWSLLASGRQVTLHELIGEGSQGAVWKASAAGAHPFAVKLYFSRFVNPVQREIIADLIDRGPPDGRLLWPFELVGASGQDRFGYAMPLRPSGFQPVSEIAAGRVATSPSATLRLGVELADILLKLHARGLCYRDISFTNVFFDPLSGSPRVCDNDNVEIEGRNRSPVLGTRRFMAPELVRGETPPSVVTDVHAFAVLLFYLLVRGHPLIGRRERDHACWDLNAEIDLFGRRPLFVFDPVDAANAPDPTLHPTVVRGWPQLPDEIQQLFIQTFTDGLSDPEARVRESVWRRTLCRARDRLVACPSCQQPTFLDLVRPASPCGSCAASVPSGLWLNTGRAQVAATPGMKLLRHHLHGDYDLSTVVGTIEEHPQHPGVLGVRNATTSPWSATVDDRVVRVGPGQAVRLAADVTIDFGVTSGRVQAAVR